MKTKFLLFLPLLFVVACTTTKTRIPLTEQTAMVQEKPVSLPRTPPPLPPPAPKKKATAKQIPCKIIIDPGHGGDNFGASTTSKPKHYEKFLTLTTALMVRDELQQMGYKVVCTRSKDRFIGLQERVAFAAQQKADLFVSVHFNWAPVVEAHGVEVFYYSGEKATSRSKASKRLAEAVLANVVANTHAKSRGAKNGDFCVVRDTKMPAILVEGGFLSHSEEQKRLKNTNYLKRLAHGIAIGVDSYYQKISERPRRDSNARPAA